MTTPPLSIEAQVEAAYDYRGHVTLTLKDGSSFVGYLFNREFDNPKNPERNFIEVIPKDSEERRRIPLSALGKIELTGKDCAAGNSFEDYLKKKAQQAG